MHGIIMIYTVKGFDLLSSCMLHIYACARRAGQLLSLVPTLDLQIESTLIRTN